MNTLLEKVKANLILGHSVDDELLLWRTRTST